jgi:hypothetical protein
MSVSAKEMPAIWLLLVFSLPTAKASERVGVWRKLQRYGAVPLPASGYVLPNNSMNQERFEWLAASIRGSKGQAAIANVFSFDDLRDERIQEMFNQARTREYQALEKELKRLRKTFDPNKAKPAILRLKNRLQQIVEIDFFGSPIRARIEEAMRELENDDGMGPEKTGRKNPKDYVGRTWITRPQPGIDRVSCAWMIHRYIDSQATFVFDKDHRRHPNAIPFDMFNAGGFGHVGNDCSFETLVKNFRIKDSRVNLIAQAIHDADFADEHFGRTEALGIDRILDGWNKQGIASDEVLRRGMDMFDGLYNGIR